MLQVMFADKHFVNCKFHLSPNSKCFCLTFPHPFSAHKSASEESGSQQNREVPLGTRARKDKVFLDRLTDLGQAAGAPAEDIGQTEPPEEPDHALSFIVYKLFINEIITQFKY